MFQQLFERPHALQRQLTSPLLDDRLRYLTHRAEQGALPRTLREIALYLLIVLKHLPLTNHHPVTLLEIEKAATRWSQRQTRRLHRTGQSLQNSKNRFRRHATRWLSFLFRLKIQSSPPRVPQVTAFIDFMQNEQGLSEQTIQYRQHVADQFLKHIRRHGHSLASVTLPQIDSLLLQKYHQGLYAPSTIQTQASSLRAFLRYAEGHCWCRPGLSAGIKTPRVYHHATLPSSPTWGNHPTPS
ncbi:MAG: site-specific integrase [Elusimicrobia bacterium]|nr:site-specific integrase [Elusimicrobiota bacterium]